jgi:hypothetical protein
MKTTRIGLRAFIGEMGNVQRAIAFIAACLLVTVPARWWRIAVEGHRKGRRRTNFVNYVIILHVPATTAKPPLSMSGT